MNKSIGERRVRIEFNPSNEDSVFQAKAKAAELINTAMHEVIVTTDPEVERLARRAADRFEEGAMYLVKALTANK